MASPATAPVNATPEPTAPRFTLLDIAIVVLAFAGLALAVVDIFFKDAAFEAFPAWPLIQVGGTTTFLYFVVADLAIAAFFLSEFLISAYNSGDMKRYAKGSWYDLVGSVPVTLLPGFTAFRLLRVVRIVVVGSRFIRASNLTFGEAVVKRLFGKYRDVVVQELTTPILITGISLAQNTVAKGRYAESIGVALDTQRAQIHALILENLKRNSLTAKMIEVPTMQRVLLAQEKAIIDAVVTTLTSDETNQILQASIQTTLDDFKAELQGRKATRRLEVSDAANGDPYLRPITPRALEGSSGP